jgi:hypothetical protein
MKEYTDYDESDAERCVSTFHYVMVAIFVVALLALFTGCAHTKYVTVVEHHTDSVYIAQHQRDSIFVHDSTFVEVKGDTTLIERWHTAWRERVVHDTSVVVRIDSVPMPYPVEKKVEKQLSWWQKTQMYAGDVLLLLLMGGAVYGIIKLRHK